MNRNDCLDTAKNIINGERQGTYGKAENGFARIATLWSGYLGRDIKPEDVANMMILMKVVRNASGVYKDDNWVDICGYAALGCEIQDKNLIVHDHTYDTPKNSGRYPWKERMKHKR